MKRVLFVPLIMFHFFAEAQNTTVSGVITYFFNEYQGNKPDLGAKAYLIEKKTVPYFDISMLENFNQGLSNRELYASLIKLESIYLTHMKQYEGKKKHKAEYDDYKLKYDDTKKSENECLEEMKKYGVDTDQKLKDLDKTVFSILSKANGALPSENQKSYTKTIDANGNYSFNTKAGDYYILIISKNRTGYNMSTVLGKFYCKELSIKDGENVEISTNFEL